MHEIKESIDIAAPVETVFDFVADFRNALRWMHGFNRFEPITSQTRGTGAKVRASGRIGGVPISTELEITQYLPNRKIVSVSNHGLKSLSAWLFEPKGTGTKVSFIGYYDLPRGPLGALMSWGFINDLLLEHTWKSLKNLKKVMESAQDQRAS